MGAFWKPTRSLFVFPLLSIMFCTVHHFVFFLFVFSLVRPSVVLGASHCDGLVFPFTSRLATETKYTNCFLNLEYGDFLTLLRVIVCYVLNTDHQSISMSIQARVAQDWKCC
jgi:hypothetical protein